MYKIIEFSRSSTSQSIFPYQFSFLITTAWSGINFNFEDVHNAKFDSYTFNIYISNRDPERETHDETKAGTRLVTAIIVMTSLPRSESSRVLVVVIFSYLFAMTSTTVITLLINFYFIFANVGCCNL